MAGRLGSTSEARSCPTSPDFSKSHRADTAIVPKRPVVLAPIAAGHWATAQPRRSSIGAQRYPTLPSPIGGVCRQSSTTPAPPGLEGESAADQRIPTSPLLIGRGLHLIFRHLSSPLGDHRLRPLAMVQLSVPGFSTLLPLCQAGHEALIVCETSRGQERPLPPLPFSLQLPGCCFRQTDAGCAAC